MLAIVVVALGVFVSACGGGGDSTSGEEGSGESAGNPVKGGVLKFARSQDVDVGLNPINAPSNGSIFVIQQIFDQLVEIAGGNEVVPGLATKWESSPDGLTWTFYLRDAKFSNGEPVTGEDVKFSIEQFADPEINVNYSTLGESINDVEVVDPKTVKVNLKHVDASFLDNISMFAAAILPEKGIRKGRRKSVLEEPSRNRPVQTEGIRPGQKTVLERNPMYWRSGQPYLDGIIFEYVPDANTRVLKIRSDEAEVADAIPYNQVASLEGTEGVEVQVSKALSWTSIFLNETKKPLQDKKIRQALNYATPKEQILESVYFGNAEIANSNIPPLKYWDESLAAYPFDIEKAEELMAESSAPKGVRPRNRHPVGRPGRAAGGRNPEAGMGQDRRQGQHRPAGLRGDVLGMARRQGRNGDDLPRRRALQRHALRRRDRGDHARSRRPGCTRWAPTTTTPRSTS